eukprot:scaffold1954_cov268-Pinguiococcus_pyrenoidosus.AAC.173
MDDGGAEGLSDAFAAGVLVERLSEGDRVDPTVAQRILSGRESGDSSDLPPTSLPRGRQLLGALDEVLGADVDRKHAPASPEDLPMPTFERPIAVDDEDVESIRNTANALDGADEDVGEAKLYDLGSFSREARILSTPREELVGGEDAAEQLPGSGSHATSNAAPREPALSSSRCLQASHEADASENADEEATGNQLRMRGPQETKEALKTGASGSGSGGDLEQHSNSPTGKEASKEDDLLLHLRDSLMEMEQAVRKLDELRSDLTRASHRCASGSDEPVDALEAFIEQASPKAPWKGWKGWKGGHKSQSSQRNVVWEPPLRETYLNKLLEKERSWMKDEVGLRTREEVVKGSGPTFGQSTVSLDRDGKRKTSPGKLRPPDLTSPAFLDYILIPVGWHASWVHASMKGEPALEAYQAGYRGRR